jgi:hypothetical protein
LQDPGRCLFAAAQGSLDAALVSVLPSPEKAWQAAMGGNQMLLEARRLHKLGKRDAIHPQQAQLFQGGFGKIDLQLGPTGLGQLLVA